MKNTEKKFYIIGGQYESKCYGGSDTLTGAKQIATRHREYWDNWRGWHTPVIYKAEDTILVESRGRITTRDGMLIRVPKEDAESYCYRCENRWSETPAEEE